MHDLENIVKLCILNDSKAQQKFYNYYYKKITRTWTYQYNYIDQFIKEDILQESFIIIFNNLHTIRNIKPNIVMGWCKKIVKNKIIDYIRSKKLDTISIDKLQNDNDTINDIKENYITYTINKNIIHNFFINTTDNSYLESKNIEYNQILDAIEELPKQYKKIFKMYAIDNLKHREIANKLNISVGASKSSYSRARIIVKNKLFNNYFII